MADLTPVAWIALSRWERMTNAETWETNVVYSQDQAPEFQCVPLYAAPTAAPDMRAALDKIFSYVSYVNIHGVGEQPEPNGLPQPMRVPPDEFARIFQEIGKLASSALSKAEVR